MKNSAGSLIFLWGCFLITSCGSESSSESIDDLERPNDWESHWELTLLPDTVNDAKEEMMISTFSTTQPIETLAEQLFSLAFSGDAIVYPPDLFGEIDISSELDPKGLVNELKSYDTVLVENILTGEFKDTVIDNSFSLEKTSAMVLAFEFSDQSGLDLRARSVAFGVQVFDEESGVRRGNAKKFYIQFMDEQTPSVGQDQIMLYTDSLGMFFPHSISIYNESTTQSFGAYIRNTYGYQPVKLSFDISLNFKDADLAITNVKVNNGVKQPL